MHLTMFSTGTRHRLFSRFRRQKWQCSRREYQDLTLQWAQQNPEIAQECLRPPWWDLKDCDPNFSSVKTNSLEEFCLWRKWPHSTPDSQIRNESIAISSHLLSVPLTLASFYINCGFTATSNGQNKRWCLVGARAESTLPHDYWKEFLLLCSSATPETNSPIQISLDFAGPDVQTKTPDRTVYLEDDSAISLRWFSSGLLHEIDDQWDAYIFLNPGFGHPHLRKGWKPTLERIIQEKKPLLLTAHSGVDAERDSKCLELYGLEVVYSSNPFASRIKYEDPFASGHVVRPNHCVASVFAPEESL